MPFVETFALFGIDPESIAQAGLWLIAIIIFTETGLLVGFFLPGDTLLIAAGVLASQGALPLGWTIVTITTAAIIGDNVGYTIGRYSGKKLFKKQDGILFRQEYVERAQVFYEKHGGKTIILARFIPIVRTFAPMVAGIGKMNRTKFFIYNVVGAIIWAVSLVLVGYYIGSRIPKIGDYLEYAIIAVVILSFLPALYHIATEPKARQMIKEKIQSFTKRSSGAKHNKD